MKNHEWIDGKLLQTNKKYSHLKQKQKERIYQWMYDAYKAAYLTPESGGSYWSKYIGNCAVYVADNDGMKIGVPSEMQLD